MVTLPLPLAHRPGKSHPSAYSNVLPCIYYFDSMAMAVVLLCCCLRTLSLSWQPGSWASWASWVGGVGVDVDADLPVMMMMAMHDDEKPEWNGTEAKWRGGHGRE